MVTRSLWYHTYSYLRGLLGADVTVVVVGGADGFVDGTMTSSGSTYSGAVTGVSGLGAEPKILDNASAVTLSSS